jgi:hypothetical protein
VFHSKETVAHDGRSATKRNLRGYVMLSATTHTDVTTHISKHTNMTTVTYWKQAEELAMVCLLPTMALNDLLHTHFCSDLTNNLLNSSLYFGENLGLDFTRNHE